MQASKQASKQASMPWRGLFTKENIHNWVDNLLTYIPNYIYRYLHFPISSIDSNHTIPIIENKSNLF